jgi:hypothetical protein
MLLPAREQAGLSRYSPPWRSRPLRIVVHTEDAFPVSTRRFGAVWHAVQPRLAQIGCTLA